MKSAQEEYAQIKEVLIKSNTTTEGLSMTKRKGWITLSHSQKKSSVAFIRRKESTLDVKKNTLHASVYYDVRQPDNTADCKLDWTAVLLSIHNWLVIN